MSTENKTSLSANAPAFKPSASAPAFVPGKPVAPSLSAGANSFNPTKTQVRYSPQFNNNHYSQNRPHGYSGPSPYRNPGVPMFMHGAPPPRTYYPGHHAPAYEYDAPAHTLPQYYQQHPGHHAGSRPVSAAPSPAVYARPAPISTPTTPAMKALAIASPQSKPTPAPVAAPAPAAPVAAAAAAAAPAAVDEEAALQAELAKLTLDKQQARADTDKIISSPKVQAACAAKLPQVPAVAAAPTAVSPQSKPAPAPTPAPAATPAAAEEEEEDEDDEEMTVSFVAKQSYTIDELRAIIDTISTRCKDDRRYRSAIEETPALNKAFATLPTVVSEKGGKVIQPGWRKGPRGDFDSRKGKRHGKKAYEPPADHAPLDKAENAYKVRRDFDADELKIRQVRVILNKLSASNLNKLADEVKALDIDSEELMRDIVNVVFEKTVSEPHFSAVYASFCDKLRSISYDSPPEPKLSMAERLKQKSEPAPTANDKGFLQIMLTLSQKTFEEYASQEALDVDPADLEAVAANTASRRRFLGAMRFFGELFLKGVLRGAIMKFCIDSLLKRGKSNDEEDKIEALCRLLTTIGKSLDSLDTAILNAYMPDLQALTRDKSLSARIRFLVLDVVELRINRWASRGAPAPIAPLQAPKLDRYSRAAAKDKDNKKDYSYKSDNQDVRLDQKRDHHKMDSRDSRDNKGGRFDKPRGGDRDNFRDNRSGGDDGWTKADKPEKKPNKNNSKSDKKGPKPAAAPAPTPAPAPTSTVAPYKAVKNKVAAKKPTKKPVSYGAFGGLLSDDEDEDEHEEVEEEEADDTEIMDVQGIPDDEEEVSAAGQGPVDVPNEVVRTVKSAVQEFFGTLDLNEVRHYIGETSEIDNGAYNFAWISSSLRVALDTPEDRRVLWLNALPKLAEGENALDKSMWAKGFLQLCHESGDIVEDFPNALRIIGGVVVELIKSGIMSIGDVTSTDVTKAFEFVSPRAIASYYATIINGCELKGADLDQTVSAVVEILCSDEEDAKDRLTSAGVTF